MCQLLGVSYGGISVQKGEGLVSRKVREFDKGQDGTGGLRSSQ